MKGYKIKILASGGHAHLSDDDLETLFGKGAKLEKVRDLGDGRSGQFLSDKKVQITLEKGSRMLSVLGPTRKETQVELSYTEARALGARPPIGDSGELEGTMGFKLTGPAGSVELERGLMVPRRHIHLNEHEIEAAGFGDKDFVNVRVEGPRAMVMENVLVRIGKGGTVMHVDYDEMNAAGLTSPAEGWAYKE